MCFGYSGVQLGDVQLSSVIGLHGGAIEEAHRQGSLSFDSVQARCIDSEKVTGVSEVQYCCFMLFKKGWGSPDFKHCFTI
jgi:hypothetical protein